MDESTLETFSVEEAAAWLKVHPRTIQLMARTGRLRAAKIGRRWVFRHADLRNFLDAQFPKAKGRPRAA